jgi:BirA family biotin operon repressor/biotin-[acetyl-CoA-carboxylase] ligase
MNAQAGPSPVPAALPVALPFALSRAAIDACCAAPLALDIEVVAETGSTNADLLARLDQLDGAAVLIAERQHAGRGRAGRSWLSAPGASLTFSLAWKFHGPLHHLLGLPLAVGVALAESMDQLGVPVTLKWPNDVLRDGAKLAGILIETRSGAGSGRDQTSWAVIGIGINLLLPDALEARIDRPAACAPWLAQMDRNRLMAALLTHLTNVLTQFDADGFAAFHLRWNALHAHQGQHVSIIDRGQVVHEGCCRGVDQLGRLLLDTAGGRLEIVSGDVSLRPKQPPMPAQG